MAPKRKRSVDGGVSSPAQKFSPEKRPRLQHGLVHQNPMGSAAAGQSRKQASLVKGKFALFWMLETREECDSCPKASSTLTPLTVLPLTVSGEASRRSFRVCRWKEGLHQNSTVSSGRHWWSEQQHLDCLEQLTFNFRASLTAQW